MDRRIDSPNGAPAAGSGTRPSRLSIGRVAAAAAPLLLAAAPALAQRSAARISWQSRECVIEYGAVRIGGHSLAELPPGGTWRLGNNNATTLVTRAPLQSGDAFVAPGGYKLSLARTGTERYALAPARAGFALGATEPGVHLAGTFATGEKPAKELSIECAALPGRPSKASLSFDIRVRYGPYSVSVPAILHGAAAPGPKVRGFAVDVWAIPSSVVLERMKSGLPTPVATLTKKPKKKGDPEAWNVVVARDAVSLRPAPAAPTENFGFGKLADDEKDPAEEELARPGTLQWAPSQETTGEAAALARLPAEEARGEDTIVLRLACGARTMTLTLEDPTRPEKAIGK